MTTATERVARAYAAIENSARPEVWITVIAEEIALEQAAEIDRRTAAGESLPLAGRVGALKDNIDLLGVPTTAGCPAFAYSPVRDAPCVERLTRAGLVIIGKTNLDQFATGLVGTRSPYGVVASATDPTRVAGGSSSGSAVAVALGIVDVALGTDTAGSGRVPAAFNGIVGFKPSRGLVPTAGVVPACASFDCVSVFARDVGLATIAIGVMTGVHPGDPTSREWPEIAPLGLAPTPIVAIPDDRFLSVLAEADRDRFERAVERLRAVGATTTTLDVNAFVAAGNLLYEGSFVAERYAAVGAFVEAHRDEVDPVVGEIIAASKGIPAFQLARDAVSLAAARSAMATAFADFDALLLPTVGEHPTIAEVAADPRGVNARLGRFTAFCNLLDLAAIALPVRDRDAAASTFGVTLFSPAFGDQILADLGARFLGEEVPSMVTPHSGAAIVVVGAHLAGQPLNHQLTTRGGRLACATTTAPLYRLFALPTEPPKPGLIHVGDNGASIDVEVWSLPRARFADFVAAIPPPLSIGQIELANAHRLPGFVLTASSAPDGVTDITAHRGWRAYLDASRG